MTRSAEDALDELYSALPGDFVAVRNRLAALLAAAGDLEQARALKERRKPVLSVWAVNQAVRRDPGGADALLDAGRRLVDAALRGDAGSVRDASAGRRRAVAALLEVSSSVLAELGRPPTRTVLDRIARTLYGAAVDPEAGPLLKRGLLPADVDADPLAGVALPVESGRPREPRAGSTDAGIAELRRAAEDADATAARLERAAARAQAEAERAREEAAAARRAADRAQAKLERRTAGASGGTRVTRDRGRSGSS